VVRKRIQATLTHGLNAEPIEEKLMRIDGTTFDAEVVALPINFKDKATMLVMFADITERKQAEAALRKSEENFRNLSENTVDGISIVAPNGRHVYANRHACEFLGYSPEEILQTSLIDLADPVAYPQLQQRLQDRLVGRPVPTGDARELVSELMGKVRNLSLDLRPAMLDDFGLFAALRWLFERFHGQTGILIQCNYKVTSNQHFPPSVETAAFRIVQESLTNIARHAGVQEAQVNLEIGKTLSIEITDKGTGFDPVHNVKITADSGGLSGMQERARLLGGIVQIYSEKGSGTRVVAEIPLMGGAE